MLQSIVDPPSTDQLDVRQMHLALPVLAVVPPLTLSYHIN